MMVIKNNKVKEKKKVQREKERQSLKNISY
jgi:hypothetical protein